MLLLFHRAVQRLTAQPVTRHESGHQGRKFIALFFDILRILWKLKVQKCRRLRTLAMGVLPEHRRRGIDTLLVHHLIGNAVAYGYTGSEMGWVLEDNQAMLGPLRRLGAERTKTYRVYDRLV